MLLMYMNRMGIEQHLRHFYWRGFDILPPKQEERDLIECSWKKRFIPQRPGRYVLFVFWGIGCVVV